MDLPRHPVPDTGILVTQLVVAADQAVTSAFYSECLGGEIVHEGPHSPTFIKLANTWVLVVEGGGPTPDKPDTVVAPPSDTTTVDSFMNIRVADIWAVHEEWSSRGAEFLTPPLDNGGYELRCYVKDPDGRIIEVGQATGMLEVFGGDSGS